MFLGSSFLPPQVGNSDVLPQQLPLGGCLKSFSNSFVGLLLRHTNLLRH